MSGGQGNGNQLQLVSIPNQLQKPGLAALQALSSLEHCLTMSLPSRSWNVPWSEKLNMVEVKLKNHVFHSSPSTIHCSWWFGRNIPNHLFPKAKPIDSECTEASTLSKLLSERKRQRNSNTYPPCQTATSPPQLTPSL